MLVKDLISCYFDDVIIYTNVDDSFEEFVDLYKGPIYDIPSELLDKTVRCFGAKRKNVLDISVRM